MYCVMSWITIKSHVCVYMTQVFRWQVYAKGRVTFFIFFTRDTFIKSLISWLAYNLLLLQNNKIILRYLFSTIIIYRRVLLTPVNYLIFGWLAREASDAAVIEYNATTIIIITLLLTPPSPVNAHGSQSLHTVIPDTAS